MRNSKHGFTLVELIVVITIVAIIALIAFSSYKGVTRYARNSARMTDIASVRDALEVFATKHGRYPDPSHPVPVTYSGGLVFTEGTIGDSIITNLETIEKKPIDPLYGVEYSYGLLNSDLDFEIGAALEDNSLLAQQ